MLVPKLGWVMFDDAIVAVEQQPRDRAQRRPVVALAQHRDPPLGIGHRARRRLDHHPVHRHRAEVEVLEFEPRRAPAGPSS